MQRILDIIYRTLLNARLIVMFAALAVALAFGSGMARLGFSNDYRDFFQPDDPNLVAFERLQDTFVRTNNIFIAVEATSGDMFTPDNLTRLTALTEALWQLPFVTRVDGLANHQFIVSDASEIALRDLVTLDRAITAEDAQQFRAMALQERAVNGLLVSEDPAMAGINILIDNDGITEAGKAELMAALDPILTRFGAPDFSLYKAGSVVIDHGFDVAAQSDLEMLYAAMYVVVLLLSGLLTRSWAATLGILVTMTLSWFVALGAAGLIGMKLTAISVAAPTVLMTISVAQAMHIVFAIQKAQTSGLDRKEAALAAMKHTFGPLCLVALSSLIGFMAIMASNVPPLQDLGFILSVGAVALFIFSTTFLPAFLSYFAMNKPALMARTERQMHRLADWISARTKGLAVGLGIAAIVILAAIPLNRINDNFIEYFDQSHPVRSDAQLIDARLTGVHYAYIQADAQSGSVFDPAYLTEIAQFGQWLENQPGIRHVTTYTNVQKRLNKALNADAPEAYVLPTTQEDSTQLNLLYELSLPFGRTTEDILSFDRTASKITIVLDNINSGDLLALENRIAGWIETNAVQADYGHLTGPMSMFAHIGQSNARSLLLSTFAALALVSLLLIIALGSVRLGLISIVPNLLPAAAAFGIWGLVDGQIGLAVSIVTVMTFGIVVDDTVFLMSRLKAHLHTGSFAETLRRTFADTGRPIINTTIILAAGFALLALSSFRLNQGLGALTVLIMIFALIGDLFLLPGLVRRITDRIRSTGLPRRINPLSEPAE